MGTKKVIVLIDPVLIKAFLTDQNRYRKSSFFGLFYEIVGKEKAFTETKGKHINVLDLYQSITGELVFQIFFGSDLINANINGAMLTQLAFENVVSPENVLFGMKGIQVKLFKRNRLRLVRAG